MMVSFPSTDGGSLAVRIKPVIAGVLEDLEEARAGKIVKPKCRKSGLRFPPLLRPLLRKSLSPNLLLLGKCSNHL
jgi:hypothetical protein